MFLLIITIKNREEVPWAAEVVQWVKAHAAYACGPEFRHSMIYKTLIIAMLSCNPVLGEEGGARRINWNFPIREPRQNTVSHTFSDRLCLYVVMMGVVEQGTQCLLLISNHAHLHIHVPIPTHTQGFSYAFF